MKELVYLNGEYLPRDEAKISADDRGFIFADGIYEVIKFYHGNPFYFDEHLERLKYSLSQINISFKAIPNLKGIMMNLLTENKLLNQDAGVYLQITRGAGKRVHYLSSDSEPTIYIFTFPFQANLENITNGINVLKEKDIRWQRCDIKSISLLPNVMLYDKAYRKGAGETVLIRDGFVTEASHSSVFGVLEGTVYTHQLSNHVLPGITRRVVLEICKQNNIEVVEKAMAEDMLALLDELFIAGTGSEITPVVSINGKLIRDGKPGALTKILQKDFYEKNNSKKVN